MSERKIYEIARLMSDRHNIENDMAEAMEMVTDMFRNKYVNRLHDAFGKCRDGCVKNPSKEVRLIHALKPFVAEESKEQLDKMAEMLVIMETMSKINHEASAISAAQVKNEKESGERKISAASIENKEETADNSIHRDGVYEIDKNCMLKKSGGIPTNMMSIMLAAMLSGERNGVN